MRRTPTPAWDYGNATIWDDSMDIAFVVAHSLILLITSVVGIAANTFVILAVYHQKSLQTSNNALVVNLAIIDILRCAIDCPVLLIIVVTVYQRGRVDTMLCDTQVASFSFSCFIQLLTLACISAERYQAIAQPFKKRERRKRIMFLIPVTWTLAIGLTVFCLLFVKDSLVNVRCQGSQGGPLSSYDTFGLYMLLPLWATCFSVITGFYARIFFLVRSHNRKIFDKGSSLVPKKDQTVNTHDKTKEITAVQSRNGKSEQTQTLGKCVDEPHSTRDSSAAPLATTDPPQCVPISSKGEKEKITGSIMDLETEQLHHFVVQCKEKTLKSRQFNTFVMDAEAQASNGGDAAGVTSSATEPRKTPSDLNTEHQSNEKAKIEKVPSEMKETGCQGPSPAQIPNSTSTPVLLIEAKGAMSSKASETLHQVSSSVSEAEATEQTSVVTGAVCMMPSKAGRERANKSKEGKMAKRAGYIIISFLILWLPLITTILVNLALYKFKNTQVSVKLMM